MANVDEQYTNFGGVLYNGKFYNIQWQPINITSSGNTIIIPAISSKIFRIISILFSSSLSRNVQLQSGSTIVIPNLNLGSNFPYFINAYPGYIMDTTIGQAFIINYSGSGTLGGFVNYISI